MFKAKSIKENWLLFWLESFLATQRILNCHPSTKIVKKILFHFDHDHLDLCSTSHQRQNLAIKQKQRVQRIKLNSSKFRTWLTVNDEEKKQQQSSLSTHLPSKMTTIWAHLLCLDIKYEVFIPDGVVWLKWDQFDFKRWKFYMKKKKKTKKQKL